MSSGTNHFTLNESEYNTTYGSSSSNSFSTLDLPSWTASVSFDDVIVDDPNANDTIQSFEAANKSATVFLIDANPTMWTQKNDNFAPDDVDTMQTTNNESMNNNNNNDDDDDDDDKLPVMHHVISAVITTIKNMIIAGQKSDKLSIIFFNTKKILNDNEQPGVYVYHALESLAAPIIKDLNKLINHDYFDELIGSSSIKDGGPHFTNALWACSSILQSVKNKTDKRVHIFTNRNDPTNGDINTQLQVDARVGDLYDQSTEIEIFPLHKDFDPRIFWCNVAIYPDDQDLSVIREEAISNFEALSLQMNKRLFQKRSLAHCNLEIGNDVAIAVQLYCLIRPPTKEQPRWLHKQTNQPLNCKTSWLSADTGKKLATYEIKNYVTYGPTKEKVFMSKDEMNEIKSMFKPGLTLFGFKSLDTIAPYYQYKQPYFVYPDEQTIKGSTLAFNTLMSEMHKQQRYALCRLVYRRAGMPRFVALIPQKETLYSDGSQKDPPGFHMIFLPYAEDIRDLQFEPKPIADDDVVKQAKRIVKLTKMPADFDIAGVRDPSIQQHYTVLESIALDEEVPEEFDDDLQPDEEFFDERKTVFEEYRDLVYGSEQPMDPSSKKRKRTDDPEPGIKKPKKDEAIDWSVFNTQPRLQKLTMPQLKNYLRENGLALSGKKVDLIERILDHMA